MVKAFRISIALGALLVMSGCSTYGEEVDGQAAPAAHAPLVDTAWVAEDVAGAGIVDRSHISVVFDSGGKVGGRSGCNGYSAPYKLDDETLWIGPTIGTRMACAPALMNQEAAFLDILGKVNGYRFDPTGALVLIAGDGRELTFMPGDMMPPEEPQ